MSEDAGHEHDRRVTESHAVTPLELFFDLVFVFALTQVTTLMSEDPTWWGVARGFAVLAALWWAWVGFAWLTNSIRIDEDVASRLVMLLTMATFLVCALAAPQAFGDYALLFGVAYLIVRVLHIVLYAVMTRADPDVFGAVVRLGRVLAVAPLLILAAGFVPAGPWRGVLWAVAIAVDFAAPLVAGTAGWRIDAGHVAERHGLVIIIALGESVVALGVTAAGEPLSTGLVVAASMGVVVVSALWWLYFDVVAVVAERRLASLTGSAQTAMARDSYSYIHLFMVFGIVLLALGLKKTLLHLDVPLGAVPCAALFGGVAVYLLAHVAFRLRNIGTLNVQRLVVAVVLLALIPVGPSLAAAASLAILTGLMVALVAYETVRFGEARHVIRSHHVEPDIG